jgi:hypothetical protein
MIGFEDRGGKMAMIFSDCSDIDHSFFTAFRFCPLCGNQIRAAAQTKAERGRALRGSPKEKGKGNYG